ncbi:hypothetical protein SAMN05443665_101765 [Actinomadura meyerae]|uniref:Uncharacterized protein n=1 Tax=Actinomadura meyerae TaxID=240840 RepID=A0A239K9E2_9ACTN|nr:hypothetical protein SAMN05443665_101765 [Actinomadura meyerae]
MEDEPDKEDAVVDYAGRYWKICVTLELSRFVAWIILLIWR